MSENAQNVLGVVQNEHPLTRMLAMLTYAPEAPIVFPAPLKIQLLRAQIRKSRKTSIRFPFLMMTIPSYHAIFVEILIYVIIYWYMEILLSEIK